MARQVYLTEAYPDMEAEEWKKVKVLGSSLLGNKEDLARRRALAAAAFRENYPTLKDQRLSLKLRLRIYAAYVLPVLLYNAGAWGLTAAEERKLDTMRRRHLRTILGVRWPNKIGCKKLYELTGTTSLRPLLARKRWQLVGHVLRAHPQSPARAALEYVAMITKRGRKGRPVTGLMTKLQEDYKVLRDKLSPRPEYGMLMDDIYGLELAASDRDGWRQAVEAAFPDGIG
jgi:hypothetical protein